MNNKQQQYTVVLIDDDIDEAEFLKEAIEESNLPLSLQYYSDYNHFIHSVSPSALPHLLVVDINLPIKNGLEVLHELKADETLSDIPAVTFTDGHSTRYEVESKNAGALSLIKKPDTIHGYKRIVAELYSICLNGSSNYRPLDIAC